MGLFSWFRSIFKKRNYNLNEAMDSISNNWSQYKKESSISKYEFLALTREIAKDFLSKHKTIKERDIQRIVNVAISKSKQEKPHISETEYKRLLITRYNQISSILKRIQKIVDIYDESFGPHPFLQIKVGLLREINRLLSLAKIWKTFNTSYYRFMIDQAKELTDLYNYLNNFDNRKVKIEFVRRTVKQSSLAFESNWGRILRKKQKKVA
jgi:hypothetical protein